MVFNQSGVSRKPAIPQRRMKKKKKRRQQFGRASLARLAKQEWDFCGLEGVEFSLAFWWEYSRSSETVKTEVEKMRAERKGRVWHYAPHEHRLGKVICWLAQRESFPSFPWLALPGVGMSRLAVAQNPANPYSVGGFLSDLRPGITCKHVWLGDAQAVRQMHDDIILQPSESYFRLGISWHLTDAEILELFAGIIKDARPKQFEASAVTPTVQRGFREALPFRKSAALQWLGVLRRRNNVKTWKEYFKLYPSEKMQNLDAQKQALRRTPLKPYEEETWKYDKANALKNAERACREDCDKAKRILAFFDRGTPLKKEDFK